MSEYAGAINTRFSSKLYDYDGMSCSGHAAVNGKAFGGGLEMILAADFAYGVDYAKLWFPEVMIGILPGVGGTTTLHALLVSVELMNHFSGGAFGAAEALEWGIFNRVCSAKELMPAVIATAETIAGMHPGGSSGQESNP